MIKKGPDEEGYKWRVNLLQSKKYWKCNLKQSLFTILEWFTGMNQAFLGTSIAKSLILADRERIDK